jgi:hypothetical protein
VVTSYIIIGAKLHSIHGRDKHLVLGLLSEEVLIVRGVVRYIVHIFSVISYRGFVATHLIVGTAFDPSNN